MKPGPATDNSPALLALIVTALVLVLFTPATIRGQDLQPPATSAPAEAAPAAAPADSHNLGSFVGIVMVSVGVLMALSVIARSFRWPRRTKKPYYPPVLFDRLNQDGIARLQEKINRVPKMRPPVYLYDRTEPETNIVFDEPVEETEIEEQPVDERFPVHAAAADDETFDENS